MRYMIISWQSPNELKTLKTLCEGRFLTVGPVREEGVSSRGRKRKVLFKLTSGIWSLWRLFVVFTVTVVVKPHPLKCPPLRNSSLVFICGFKIFIQDVYLLPHV